MREKFELRPCPMCGSTDLKHYTTGSVQSYRRGTVRCEKCGCTVRAEGGGFELYGKLGVSPDAQQGYETVIRESNEMAYRLSADKWNGVSK